MSSPTSKSKDLPRLASQIVSEILQTVCIPSVQSQHVIDLDGDLTTPEPLFINGKDDTLSHCRSRTNNRMVDDVAIDSVLVSGGDSSNELVTTPLTPVKKSLGVDEVSPCAQCEGPNVIDAEINDGGGDGDDDDGIEIVSMAVVQPFPKPVEQPILLDSDVEIDECPVVSSASKALEVDTHPPMNEYISINSDDDDDDSPEIVVCSFAKHSAINSAPFSSHHCSNCNTSVASNKSPLSRCKHILCPECMLNCIIERPHVEPTNSATKSPTPAAENEKTPCNTQPSSSSELSIFKSNPDPKVQSRASSQSSATPDAVPQISLLPTCIVPRCGAPFNRAEAFSALAPSQADTIFAPSLHAFEQWLNSPSESPNYGPSLVKIAPFTPTSTSITMTSDSARNDVAYNLPESDPSTALTPFWKWDERHTGEGLAGAWRCLVCGEHDPPRAHQSDSQSSCPPSQKPPSYPHCAYARALGVVTYIKALKDAREAQDPHEPTQHETKSCKGKTSRPGNHKKRFSQQKQSSSKRQRYGFAKGTGYAGSRHTDWHGTSLSFMERKSRMDEALTHWLQKIRWFLLVPDDVSFCTWPGFMRCLLKERGFVQHIGAILINESIMDVEERIPVFLAALQVVHAMCDFPGLRSLVTVPGDGDGGKTIAELVDSLSKQAAVLSTGTGREGLAENTAVLVKQIRKCIRLINRHNLTSVSCQEMKSVPTVAAPSKSECGDQSQSPPKATVDEGTEHTINEQEDPFESDKANYVRSMRGVQFQAVPGLASRSVFFAEACKAEMNSAASGRRQRRIAGEVASLVPSLPLSWSSTILLRVDEDRYDFLRAVIFGPEETPYDSGAFVFDIWLPLEYPSVPPKFRLLTTGSGRVRFNPNLYDSGKVCLSLLGTWSGPSWTPASTILQVLVSIQSLVLVPDPYFNEPGYENRLGTNHGQEASKHYNERVRKDSALYAIQYNIRHPYPELEEGIRLHFALKRRYIRHFFKLWFSCWDEAVQNTSGDNEAANPGAANVPEVTPDPSQTTLPILPSQASKMALSQILSNSPLGMPHTTQLQSILSASAFGPGRNSQGFVMNPSSLRSILKDLDGLETGKNRNGSHQ